MHAELEAFFAEHTAPKHAAMADIHAELRSISRLASSARKQVIEYDVLLDDAIHAPHDAAYDGKIEHMRQTFAAMQREADQLVLAARNLGQTFAQLERYMADWRADIERIETKG